MYESFTVVKVYLLSVFKGELAFLMIDTACFVDRFNLDDASSRSSYGCGMFNL